MRKKTDITIVLDSSGSMASLKKDTIGGFNTFIEDQQKQPGEASLSLIDFNNYRNVRFTDVPLKHVAPLTDETFTPSGGTALLDALGQTISDTGNRLRALKTNDRPDKVVFVIFTDGEENASHSFTRERVFEMIKLQHENYQWEFLFLAANQDAITVGASYGFVMANSITYGANSIGTRSVTSSLSNSMSTYRETGAMGGFSETERKEALGTKDDDVYGAPGNNTVTVVDPFAHLQKLATTNTSGTPKAA